MYYITSLYFFDSKTPCDRKYKRIPRSILNLPPSKVISLIRNNSKRGLNHSLNKVNLQYYSTNASNVENNKPILINSKEIINNYEENRLPIEVLNSKYSFSPWFIVGFVEAEGNFDISLNRDSRILPKFIITPFFLNLKG